MQNLYSFRFEEICANPFNPWQKNLSEPCVEPLRSLRLKLKNPRKSVKSVSSVYQNPRFSEQNET